jgi:hypothetical protein
MVVGVQVVVHHTGRAAFEAAQGFGGRGSTCYAFAAIGLAEPCDAHQLLSCVGNT